MARSRRCGCAAWTSVLADALQGHTLRRPKLRWPLHVLLGGAKADGHRALVEPLLPAGVSGITPSTATMGTQ